MIDRDVVVSHHKDTGFTLHVVQPTWRKFFGKLGWILESASVRIWIPGISFLASKAAHKLLSWDERTTKELVAIPITREIADKLAWTEDDWAWLDD